MKKTLLLACLFLSLTFNACQCSDPPPVGPVEGQGRAEVAAADAPVAAPADASDTAPGRA